MITLVIPHYPSQPAVTSALPERLYGVLMNQEKVTLCSVLIGFQRRTLCSVVMMQITRPAAISHYVTTGGLPLDSQRRYDRFLSQCGGLVICRG